MPYNQLVEDFKKAQQDAKPSGILDIQWGDCDAQFELLFAFPGSEQTPSKITTAVQNGSDYPKDHEYLLYCSDDAPAIVVDALQKLSGTKRKSISEFLQVISNTLSGLRLIKTENCVSTTTCNDEQHPEKKDVILNSEDDRDHPEIDNEEETDSGEETSDDDYDTDGSYYNDIIGVDDPLSSSNAFKDRLQADMRLVKEAGFEVTDLGPLLNFFDSYGYIAISIPMSELGIYEYVMNAWEIDPEEYLILILHYPKGYKTYEDLQRFEGQAYDKTNVGMRVVASKNKLPTVHEANSAFTKSGKAADQNNHEPISIREVFISKQLAALLEERLVPILRYRTGGLDWHGAESWFSDLQGMNETVDLKTIPDIYYEPDPNNKWFPDIVSADHFTSHNSTDYSFPLLAMQFTLRHFVRCTEFCLTCHRKVNLELEAIKPYFCERPLCLFQSLHLNTGYIEHEIMSQPYVVDLLISFCYNSARSYKLKEYPNGLGLMVPFVQVRSQYGPSSTNADTTPPFSPDPQFTVEFDYTKLQVKFIENPPETCPVNKDSWVVIKVLNSSEYHCRVSGTGTYPIIDVDEPVTLRLKKLPSFQDKKKQKNEKRDSGWTPATLILYNVDFDVLSLNRKCDVICKLLDTVPSVKEMQTYLSERHPGELQNWVQRLSPAALRLFRWIVVTNRACIMQVDGDNNDSKTKQDRLYGMKGYMQFRFAMGAPDKEQRFLTEVRNTTERLNLQYPTMFAWHGSPLYNWHMIIREGLHFKSADHGRAYGDGVYHARDAHTSEGYSGGMYNSSSSNYLTSSQNYWPNSVLKISSALALSEIVNAPSEFVSSNPYYVVKQLDWIQTRYLLVKCNPDSSVHIGGEVEPAVPHPQDPSRTPTGISGPIKIPVSAVNRGRWAMPPPPKKHEATGESSTGTKKLKTTSSSMDLS